MMPRLLFLFLLFAVAANAAELSPVRDQNRSAARSLLATLQADPSGQRYPEELKNLAGTIAAAELHYQLGNGPEAERMYVLALLKGELLAARLRDSAKPTLGPRVRQPVFTEQSSVRRDVPAAAEVKPAEDSVEPTATPAHDAARIRSPRIVGGDGVYLVRKNDSLKLVAARLGVGLRELATMNRLKIDAVLRVGQKLRYNNRRIVPKTMANGIIVNIPERGLYLFKDGQLSAMYPVAVGMAKKKDKTVWRTPTGKFRVVDKKENPTWTVPLSIQKEMEENGEEVLEVVPPGPRNPLGRYAVKTSLGGIMIHSTTRPTSINTFSSHGCIRVMPENMAKLFRAVTIAMPGEIIYQPVKLAVTEEGRVFLEVNRDAYEQFTDLQAEVERLIRRYDVVDQVSWSMVRQVVTDRKGVAEEVTLQ